MFVRYLELLVTPEVAEKLAREILTTARRREESWVDQDSLGRGRYLLSVDDASLGAENAVWALKVDWNGALEWAKKHAGQ